MQLNRPAPTIKTRRTAACQVAIWHDHENNRGDSGASPMRDTNMRYEKPFHKSEHGGERISLVARELIVID